MAPSRQAPCAAFHGSRGAPAKYHGSHPATEPGATMMNDAARSPIGTCFSLRADQWFEHLDGAFDQRHLGWTQALEHLFERGETRRARDIQGLLPGARCA
jgi:hypothetical protein